MNKFAPWVISAALLAGLAWQQISHKAAIDAKTAEIQTKSQELAEAERRLAAASQEVAAAKAQTSAVTAAANQKLQELATEASN